MRRSFKKPRAKRVSKPKPIAPPKQSRPKRSELKSIYKDLISNSQAERVNALVKACHWYDRVVAYLAYKQKGVWTTAQLRLQVKIQNHRALGIHQVAKEEEYSKAISYFEKLCVKFKPPLLYNVMKKYRTVKVKLAKTQTKLTDKHGEFLKQFEEGLQPVTSSGNKIKLMVDRLRTNFRINSEGNLILDRKYLLSIRKLVRKHGLFSGVLLLIPMLSDIASTEDILDTKGKRTGTTRINDRLRFASTLSMLNNFNHWAQKEDAPRTIVRRAKPRKES